MRIIGATCDVLVAQADFTDSLNTASDNAVVRVFTDAGITGIGEVECNPWVIQTLIEASGAHSMDRSLAQCMIGQDALTPEAVWDHLYTRTLLAGRRGAGIAAIGALDMAVWDIYGKASSKPIWQLLSPKSPKNILPYASLLPHGNTLTKYRDDLMAKLEWACKAGFRAVKAEIMISGPHAQPGLQESDTSIVEIVEECRRTIGDEIDLLIDVGYCWRNWEEALPVVQRMERQNLYLLETPLMPDDVKGYAELAAHTDIPIAAGELLSTRFEFDQWIEADAIDVVQPDVGRVGGITEIMRVVAKAREHGKKVVPHCWKSGISIAATAHVAAVTDICPMIEYLPAAVSGSILRQRLVQKEFIMEEGRILPSTAAGLGVELNSQILEEFAVKGHKSGQECGHAGEESSSVAQTTFFRNRRER